MKYKEEFHKWLQENMQNACTVGFILSIAFFYLGVTGQFYPDETWTPKAITEIFGDYIIWILVIGVISTAAFGFYLYGIISDIREFEKLYDIPSKSEFQRNWTRLEQLARYKLPKEYRDRMAEARKKFGLK
uniref:Uncharacterized membrane protein Ta0354 soluble domain-containing protein n=1 Tax=uncultured marine group II/III euryarchaeote AD1000_91_C10 TaxID=1457825 RepID=A0A075G0K0_9EURY|nr:hypothetical protein [uncultured marine group II/III euryarchaeote AD1000_91_C10]